MIVAAKPIKKTLSVVLELERQARVFLAGHAPLKLLAIGCAFQRSGVCAWEHGSLKPCSPLLSWQDIRTADRIKVLGASDELLWERAGIPRSAHYAGGKISFLQEEFPDPAIAVGTLDSFILANLLPGQFVTEDTMAHRTMLYNLKVGGWDQQLCEAFKVDIGRLATIKPSLQMYGELNSIPVRASLGDQQASLLYHHWLGYPVVLNLGTIASLQIYTGSVQKNLKGFIDETSIASICSVTRIVPNSAAMLAPTRPASARPVSTGASSSVTVFCTSVPTK